MNRAVVSLHWWYWKGQNFNFFLWNFITTFGTWSFHLNLFLSQGTACIQIKPKCYFDERLYHANALKCSSEEFRKVKWKMWNSVSVLRTCKTFVWLMHAYRGVSAFSSSVQKLQNDYHLTERKKSKNGTEKCLYQSVQSLDAVTITATATFS